MPNLKLEKKLKLSECMICFPKRELLENHPRVTKGMGNRKSQVLFLTHQPKGGCCREDINRPLTNREINLIDNSLSHSGVSIMDFYTVNIVKCPVETVSLPVYRKCFEHHVSGVVMDDRYTHIICMGEIVAKYVFSRGKTPPPMDMLCSGRPQSNSDFQGKKLFFTYHPSMVLNADREDMEKFTELSDKFNKSIRTLGAFLKDEGLT